MSLGSLRYLPLVRRPSWNDVSRRTFLMAGGLGLASLAGGNLVRGSQQPADTSTGGQAKSTILFFLSGGASHIDMWDMKPEAPSEYRGEFRPIPTSAPGVSLCEHLPLLARRAHELAIVNSLGHYRRGTGDHHAGYYYNLTGHAPDPSFPALLNSRTPYETDWPFVGATVGYKRPAHPYLPNLITLPQKPGAPEYTRPGQFAARLGVEYDPVYLYGNRDKPFEFTIPALTLEGDVTASRLQSRRELLRSLDTSAREAEKLLATSDYHKQQQKAFSLLCSQQTRAAFDIGSEPEAVRERYGNTINGTSLLMARRLVEAGVPFVAVFWKEDDKQSELCKSGGGWDTHGSNFHCLKNYLLPEFDRCFSALVEDLSDRGLLASTLLQINSEMGRQPKIGDPRSGGVKGAGRDHWTHCMSVVLAGGGVRGGQTYGTSDRLAEYPADNPVAPEDIAKTVYYAMGINDLEAVDREGRPFQLLEEGTPLYELF